MSRERAKHCFAPANALGPQGRGPDHRQALNTKPRAAARGFFVCGGDLPSPQTVGLMRTVQFANRLLSRHIGFLSRGSRVCRRTRVAPFRGRRPLPPLPARGVR